MFKKIMVAVDGSRGSADSLDIATELQCIHESELLILSVYRLHNSWKASVTMVYPELTESTDKALEEYAREVAEKSKQQAIESGSKNVRSFYIGGGPAREIVKFSEKHEVELIVLGSRGLSDSDNHLLGSVSHKVTSLAQCAVLIV
jgi:nucleotide-binding universal stress UspA family protein